MPANQESGQRHFGHHGEAIFNRFVKLFGVSSLLLLLSVPGIKVVSSVQGLIDNFQGKGENSAAGVDGVSQPDQEVNQLYVVQPVSEPLDPGRGDNATNEAIEAARRLAEQGVPLSNTAFGRPSAQ